MASKTEYEMLWKLGAELGKDFNGTFNSAQKILVATQKEIQALNKQQSDIAAYTRQQQSIEKSNQKLDLYKQQLANVRTEMSQSTEYSSALANKEAELQAKIKSVESEITSKTEKLQKMGDALSDSGVDVSNLSSEAERLQKELEELKEAEEKAGEEADEFGEKGSSAFESVGSALVAAGVLNGLKELASQYVECVTGAASFADEIATVSIQYGMAAEELQAYYYAAELVDVSADTLTKSMAKNIKSMKAVQDGTKLSVEAYESLGVSVLNADGTLRDSDEVYWEVIDSLGKMTNETERDAIAQQILGRSAMELNTLIVAGSGVLKEYAAEAEAAGYVMSEEMLAVCTAMDDEMQRSNSSMLAFKNTIGAAFAPEITAATKLWNQFLGGLTNFSQEHPVVVKSIIALAAEAGILLGVYTTYVAIKKTSNTLKAISSALKIKDTAATVAHTSATVAQTTATVSATAAQTGLNAAMSANPIGLILTGVAALTVGVIALTDAMQKEAKAEEQLTLKCQKEQQQLKQLNAEYKKTVELYGETSYEAQSMKWQIDELTESYEEGKMTVAEYQESLQSYLDTRKQEREEYEKAYKEYDKNYASTSALIDKLEELGGSSAYLAQNQIAVSSIVEQLNKDYEELGLTFDVTTGKFNKSITDLREYAKQMDEAKKAELEFQNYATNVGKLAGDKEAYESAKAQYEPYKDAVEEARKEYEDYIGSVAYYLEVLSQSLAANDPYGTSYDMFPQSVMLSMAWSDAEKKAAPFKEKYESTKALYEETKAAVKEFEDTYGFKETDDATESVEKLNKATSAVVDGFMTAEEASKYYGVTLQRVQNQVKAFTSTSELLVGASQYVRDGFFSIAEAADYFSLPEDAIETQIYIDNTVEKLGELTKAYEEAREAAEKSIQDQFALWEEAAVVIPTNIGTINTALETQIAYWSDYNTDLQSLISRADGIEGLSEVIATFADGSAESINAISGMASASDEELKTMIANWLELKKQQETATDSLIDLTTDYEEEINSLESALETAIEGLNLDDEATEAAKETMDAYTQAIRNGEDDAVKAAQKLSSLVAQALQFNGSISVNVSSMISEGKWKSYDDAAEAGYSNIRTRSEFARGNNADKQKYGTYDKYLDAMYQKYVTGYAVGTDNATPGVHLVGENGPELVVFNGGEKVFTAPETQVLLHKLNTENNIFNSYAKGASESVTMFSMVPMLLNMYSAERATEAVPIQAEHIGAGTPIRISIAPSFTLEGNVTEDSELRVRELADEVIDMVMDALEEVGLDAKRGAYA